MLRWFTEQLRSQVHLRSVHPLSETNTQVAERFMPGRNGEANSRAVLKTTYCFT